MDLLNIDILPTTAHKNLNCMIEPSGNRQGSFILFCVIIAGDCSCYLEMTVGWRYL
jgi:hypothetical protein